MLLLCDEAQLLLRLLLTLLLKLLFTLLLRLLLLQCVISCAVLPIGSSSPLLAALYAYNTYLNL